MKKMALVVSLMTVIMCMSIFVHAAETPAPRLTLISNVNIFDGKTEKLHKNMHVLVKDNLIETVSKEPLAIIQTDNVTMIDGGGRTLMPGLIDVHWHSTLASLPQAELLSSDIGFITIAAALGAEKTLMRGFTTVRDAGGNTFSLKKATDRGMVNGPRIYPSGAPISQTSGHFDYRGPYDVPANPTDPLTYLERTGMIMVADGPDEVIKRVREQLRLGATQIKLAAGGGVASTYDPIDVAEYTYEEMKAAVDVAKTWNTYVMVHVFTDEGAQTALKAGVISIEHGNLMSDETFKMMAEKGAWFSMQPIFNDEDAIPFPPGSPNQAKFIEVTDGTAKGITLAKKYGVKMAFGTDVIFDPGLADKQGKFLAKLKNWFTPYEILKMATSTNAELLAMCNQRNPYPKGPLGVIKEGAYADLILVNGNPLENIDLVVDSEKNFLIIMKDGVIYKNTIN